MNIRKISIWLSLVVLLGIGGIYGWLLLKGGFFGADVSGILWLLTYYVLNGVPLIVTMAISVWSKHPPSHILSATISFLYGFCFVITVIGVMYDWYDGPALILVSLMLLPILVPLWIANIAIEQSCRTQYGKKKSIP